MELPTWEESKTAIKTKKATALQEFIYYNEPAKEDGACQFRAMLANALEEAVKNNSALSTGE